ncbi:MAG: DUF4079 domain-containing protein [Cyanobacteriota bacterium]|nr:DUF4079 domain-containing protein [Cyanobacteriota bacterium]
MKYWLYPIHPIIMWVLFVLVLYAFYLGVQVRRTRTATGETKQVLSRERFDRAHHRLASVLLAGMTLSTLVGMGVDYLNTGQLFIGPHLIPGAIAISLMATTAALAPWMQQGKSWARNLHLGLGMAIASVFSWQVFSGFYVIWEIITGQA